MMQQKLILCIKSQKNTCINDTHFYIISEVGRVASYEFEKQGLKFLLDNKIARYTFICLRSIITSYSLIIKKYNQSELL